MKKSLGSFGEFIEDLSGSVVLIDPSPNLMSLSGSLRDLRYSKSGGTRTLATPDAIMLATVMHLEDDLGVTLKAFHTYDAGKAKGPEGKLVPLLTYEEWCEGLAGSELADRAIRLPRCKPIHHSPELLPG
ncbi:MAG: hypothetical protein JSS54_04380 [Proteobacteria bacterium]|nr:hypothetical protein [Pseudomonadota bacterium]